MSKIVRLGIERDNDMMYYIKDGDVWASPRKQPGQPKGRAVKVADTNIELDYSRFIYFLDSDGDVARKERALGGGRRRSKGGDAGGEGSRGKGGRRTARIESGTGGTGTGRTRGRKTKKTGGGSPRSSITGHFVKSATARRHPRTTVVEAPQRGRKSGEQLDREIDEFLGGNGASGRGGSGNGGSARAASSALRRRR